MWTAKIQYFYIYTKLTLDLLIDTYCFKSSKYTIFKGGANFNRVTTHLAILHIRLGFRRIQKHRDLFPAVRTLKKMLFHNSI